MTMNDTRRSLLKTTVFGAGALGLRRARHGLPVSFLRRPLDARPRTSPAPTRAARST
jgi:hypothetical protein